MKNILTGYVLLLLMAGQANAQDRMGKFQAGVSVGANSVKTDRERMSYTSFIPSFGIFTASNTVLGIVIPVRLQQTVYAVPDNNLGIRQENATEVGIGPFARFYIPLKRFRPFIQAEAFYAHRAFRLQFEQR